MALPGTALGGRAGVRRRDVKRQAAGRGGSCHVGMAQGWPRAQPRSLAWGRAGAMGTAGRLLGLVVT
jgi:hypothetical protein